jgi:uncharacterized protein (TIGR00290 family)
MKAFMSWSGGKDSALALYKAEQEGTSVQALVTSVNTAANRISMHGVRRDLLKDQATAIGLPLHTIEIPEMPGMETYEQAARTMHRQLKDQGFSHGLFGDIFLEDLRQYRQELLAKDGLQGGFPIWGMKSRDIMEQFIAYGFRAIIVCINSSLLDKSFCGRELDASFLQDLPSGIDPCGENGEYHSFVYDGPLFSHPIHFSKEEIVFKEYAAPRQDDCFATPQSSVGFYFQDLQKP